MKTPEAKPKRRPRISLLSLLLLMTTLSFGIGLWRQHQSTEVYRLQIARLRNEVGEVVVSDPTKLTVQALEGSLDVERHFRWRAYLPPGHYGHVKLAVATDAKPRVKRLTTLYLDQGETGFEISALEHKNGKSWMWFLGDANHHGAVVSGPIPPWLTSDVSMYDVFDPRRPPSEVAEGKQVELLRHAAVIPKGERVEVIVTIFHHLAADVTPMAKSATGIEPLPASLPNR